MADCIFCFCILETKTIFKTAKITDLGAHLDPIADKLLKEGKYLFKGLQLYIKGFIGALRAFAV